VDNELSVRAGLNIGIEPTLLPFVQAAAGNAISIALSGDTIIAEHSENAARVPFATAFPGIGVPVGYVWNTGAALATSQISFFFVDELGNEIQVANTALLTPGSGPFVIGFPPGKLASFFCLAPEEKIVARVVIPPGP
jgi:hypothetical protein